MSSLLAYTVHPKLAPMRATVVESHGFTCVVDVEWFPSKIITRRTVPRHTLRPWSHMDTQRWNEIRTAAVLKRAKAS